MIKKYIALFLIPLLLVGCNRDKPLTGTREAIQGITYTDLEVVPTSNVVISPNSSPKLKNNLKILWKRSIGRKPIISNFVMDNNNLYIMDSNGNLCCINKNSGKILYKKFITNPPQLHSFCSAISINNGIIYIGTNTNEVIAFNTKNKKILWNKKFNNAIKGAPGCFKDKVIVNTINNITYALNKKTGEIIWNYSSEEESLTFLSSSAPVLYNNSIILMYSSGDIVSLDLTTGKVNWHELLIPNYMYSSGANFLQSVVNPIIIGSKVLISNVSSMMVLLDAEFGTKVWEKKIGTISNPVIVNNEWVFVIADNNVLCINLNNGNIQWKLDLKKLFKKNKNYNDCPWYGPLLINNQLWVFSGNADVLKLNLSNGKVIEQQYIHHVMHTDTPTIDNHKMFAQVRGNIYALQ
ncbi:MAG: PQQ-like beta-propeller repeat protein [Alphaproteobacteria bacterium]|nr:PQQ-like beta-propeller repeat protein [Alphaproteobacteria bacterium]